MSAAIFSLIVAFFFLHSAYPLHSLPLPDTIAIPAAVRTTVKHDVVGHYKLQAAWSEVFSQSGCPADISITSFWHDVSLAPSSLAAPRQFNMQIPHAVMTVNGKTCDSSTRILAVESEHPFAADKKTLIVETFCRGGRTRPSTVSRLCSEQMVKSLERSPFVFGYDWGELSCSGLIIPEGHSFMFVQPKWDVIVSAAPVRRVLPGGKKYLFLTRKDSAGACVYQLFKNKGKGPIVDPSLKDPTISVMRNGSVTPRPTEVIENDVVELNTTTPSPIPQTPSVVDDGDGGVSLGDAPNIGVEPIQVQTRRDCFPATAKLTLADGTQQSMEHLSVGTRVLSAYAADHSSVYAFSHKDALSHSEYVRIATDSGNSIALSPGHYLHVNGQLRTARSVRPGHVLETHQGTPTRVTLVSREISRGLFAPHTLHGDLIVDNIRVSSYTQALHPVLAHRILAPLRIFHRMGITVPGVHHIAGALARFAPGGPEVVDRTKRI